VIKSLGAKTVVYPAPVFIVGTYDREGRPNAMAAAWGGICCSRPPCVAVSLRKATYTYGNIVARQAFTVSIPSTDYVREADYFGLASGAREDKFSVTGLTPVHSDLVDAPYVAEFPFALECRLLHTVEIGLHTQFIGEIVDIKADESALDEDGTLDIERVRPFLFAPENRAYYGVGAYLGEAFSIGREIKG
jgi:flavin reductase (DIM6/NTAB) family NADH-FMN oxidoreductase RutF